MISVEVTESEVYLAFPYKEEAKDAIKDLGGKWNPYDRCWVVQKEMEQEARQVLIRNFGTDGDTPVDTVTVKVSCVKTTSVYGGPVSCCGKVIARAWGRDSGAKVGEDVALLQGRIKSGGSRKNWTSIVEEGAVFKLVNVLPALVDDYDHGSFEVEVILDDCPVVNPLAVYSDDDIMAEARRRGLIE